MAESQRSASEYGEHSVADARIEARLPAEVKALIQDGAALTGRSLSDFVVSSAAAAAEVAIREERMLRLTRRDSELFLATLENPGEPNEALLRAIAHRRELLGE